MENFQELGLPAKLLKALDDMKFTTPTPIQAQTIPVALTGKDVLGTAQTGTGKTGAFAIPLAAKLIDNPQESLIVLTPTRELATQVAAVFRQLLAVDKSIKTALLIGGESIDRQFRQLRNRPRVVVGTPGRVNDHIKRRTLDLRQTRSLVLDESDLMLDMGFDVQIETIIDQMPEGRQTLMFSATLPRKIEKMASRYLSNPIRVSVGQQSAPGEGIEQETVMVKDTEKYSQLMDQLDQRAGSVIIFVKTKRGADKLSRRLNDEKYKSAAIHGDLRQSKRDTVLRGFRNEKYRIMVATDVAARGIDVPHIRHVINYDLPQCPEDYIHRIGRTGRAGEKGSAVSFITRQDRGKWYAIERLLDPNAKAETPGERHASRAGARRNKSESFSRSGSRGGSDRRDGGRDFKKKSWGDRDGDRRDRDRDGGRDFKKKSWGDRDGDRRDRDGGRDFKKKSWGDRDGDNRNDRGSFRNSDRKDRNDNQDFKKKSWGDRDGDRRDKDRDGGRDFKKKSWGDRDGDNRNDLGSFRDSDRRDRDTGGSFKKKTWENREGSRENSRDDRRSPEKGSSWRDRDASKRDGGSFHKKKSFSGSKSGSRGGSDSRGGFNKKPSFSKGKPGGSWKKGGTKPRASAY